MRGAGERVGCRGLPGCSIMRAFLPFANIGVLRAGRAQPLYLLTPAGRFALRATAHRADAPLRRAHGFAAPLRVALGLRPKCPQGTRFPARLPGFGAVPGRSIVAEGAGRAHRSFRSLANIGVLCAGRAQPLYLLTPSGRFGPLAQVPTGHTLPFGAPPGRFGPLAQQPTGLTLPSGAPKTCAAAQKESVASAQRAQETRHTPPSQKPHQRPFASIKKNRPPPHKRERAATRPAGSIRQTDSPSDTAATRAGCRRCPQRPGT